MSTTRGRVGGTPAVIALTTAFGLIGAAPASAHERWFVDETPAADWSFVAQPLALGALVAVVLVTISWRAVAVRFRTPELPPLRPFGRLVPYIPRLLGIHLGVSLLALAARAEFLSPALPIADVPGGPVLALLEGAVGVWLITGVQLRWAALVVIALGPALWGGAGAVALLENAALVGIAAFLVVLPPSDAPLGRVELDRAAIGRALLPLRVGAAISLVSLAFSEKFTNPEMARATLTAHPQLDVFAMVALDVPVDVFVVIAGAVEVLFGLLVLSGAAPQVVVLVTAVPFNLTLLIFGATELVGHLPVYGILLALLVYGSEPATAPLVRALPRLRARRRLDVLPVTTSAQAR